VTVSICYKRSRFIKTVTVWAVGLPRLLRIFDDKTRVTGYPLQLAERSSGSLAVVAVAKLVGGGRGARYPCGQDE